MNTALWIVQAFLGLSFTLSGLRKMAEEKIKLAAQIPWTGRFPATAVKGIGLLELLAGIGFILPHLLGIQPQLTPITALTVAVAMLLATIYHLRFKEGKSAVVNVVILLLAGFVALGRNEEQYFSQL